MPARLLAREPARGDEDVDPGVLPPSPRQVGEPANQAYWWSQAEVEDRLRTRMAAAWRDVLETSAEYSLTLRLAATVLAVKRVAEAHLRRGLYP